MPNKPHVFFIILLLSGIFSTLGFSQKTAKTNEEKMIFYGREYLLLEGTEISDSLKENPYDRLPVAYKSLVREPVWNLSKASAGLSIRFQTNSSNIAVKWTLLNDNSMNHMAETGIKGIDLYYKNGENWQYLNTARPVDKENEYTLITNMSNEMREYKMYLPLYDGLEHIEVGIDSSGTIKKPLKGKRKPIIFYGTSITQGGCASRPGMAHTNIISRKLDVDCINFGFSGNGKMEQPIVELISESDPSFYVIECLPNMTDSLVTERTIPLVDMIRKKHPQTPIVLVENFIYAQNALDKNRSEGITSKNEALKREYNKMTKNGYEHILYLETKNATGSDQEGTVDGVHFTDLGFIRYADFLIEKFDQLGLSVQTIEE
ncbi:SGNH/GDSL hydrolase family protein [Flexithrix dorotheae]|uniref:SGNH/GDSL hydrolase family protein n=1 Tax=Flexithrix dorotheae TaxID=70993 RepID=UPI00036AF875|nr:SGNH/GDSL hydrolase family protein [Flexithrix dorotheae]